MIDTEEEVQGECRDHGGKELQTETENREDDELIVTTFASIQAP